jgi:alpha-1,3-mannosyltransferase
VPHQSEAVLHTFLRELPILIAFLGPQRLHISVYENGSTDRTVALLRHLAWQLHQLGASFTVHSVGDVEESHKESGHRIHVLAALRNKLLLPLSDPEVAGPGGRFET